MVFRPGVLDLSGLSRLELEQLCTGVIEDVQRRQEEAGGEVLADKDDLFIINAIVAEVARRMIASGDRKGAREYMERLRKLTQGTANG